MPEQVDAWELTVEAFNSIESAFYPEDSIHLPQPVRNRLVGDLLTAIKRAHRGVVRAVEQPETLSTISVQHIEVI